MPFKVRTCSMFTLNTVQCNTNYSYALDGPIINFGFFTFEIAFTLSIILWWLSKGWFFYGNYTFKKKKKMKTVEKRKYCFLFFYFRIHSSVGFKIVTKNINIVFFPFSSQHSGNFLWQKIEMKHSIENRAYIDSVLHIYNDIYNFKHSSTNYSCLFHSL